MDQSLTKARTRTESDILGTMEVPADILALASLKKVFSQNSLVTAGAMTDALCNFPTSDSARFSAAIRRFDVENARDPNMDVADGVSPPRAIAPLTLARCDTLSTLHAQTLS